MALPGFRPSVQLSEDPPRLTDRTSGRTLTISRGEARLLSLYDGVKTNEQLAQAAQAAGFPVEASHVAGLIERVAHAGFMTEAPPNSLNPGPELEQSSDVVPSLRPDLKIQKSEKSPGLLEVTDPVRGQTFSLYDFEVSIARMLNGRRTAAQIIDAAAKIGIPVSLESLGKFLKQLRAYHFVLEIPIEPVRVEGGTWSPRSQWKPEVRELFQSALRKFRAGKAEDAIDYIVALLQIDPDNGEARELQQRINAKLDEASEIQEFTFDELHGGADAAPEFMESAPAPKTDWVAPSSGPEHLPRSVTGPQRTFSPPAGSPAAWQVRGPSLENPMPPLGDSPVSTSDVRRRVFDKSGAELTAEQQAPDLGEPLHLSRTPSGEQPRAFEPELINLRTPTGEQRAAGPFDPERIDTGSPESQEAASQAEGIWAPPPKRKTMPPRPAAELEDEEPPRRKRSKAPLVIGVLALAGIAGAAAFPVPTQGHEACRLEAIESAKATVSAEVKLRTLLVKDGDPVEQGKPIATLDASAIETRIKDADAKTAQLTEQLAALDKKVKPKLKARAEAALIKAKKPLLKLEASDQRLLAQKAKFEGPEVKPSMKKKPLAAIAKKLKENEKARVKAQKVVTAAENALKRLSNDKLRTPINEQLATVKTEKEAAEKELENQSILSPASGTWRASDKAAGAELKAGDVLGSIVTTDKLALSSMVKQTHATLVGGGLRKPVTLKDGAATVDNADGALKPGTCELEFDGGKQPLYKRYLRP